MRWFCPGRKTPRRPPSAQAEPARPIPAQREAARPIPTPWPNPAPAALLLGLCILATARARPGIPAAGPAPAPNTAPPATPESPQASPAANPVISPVPRETEEAVVLYFPHRSRRLLVREVRRAVRRGEAPEWFALTQLLEGPATPDARPLVLGEPPADAAAPAVGSPLLSSKVLDGTLYLYVSPAAGAALARSGSLLDVYALVNTAAQFPRVERVELHVAGETTPLQVEGVEVTRGSLFPRWDLIDSFSRDSP